MNDYQFEYKQIFNVFGAPGIPKTYRAYLFKNGRLVQRKDFWTAKRAERQCRTWVELFRATVHSHKP